MLTVAVSVSAGAEAITSAIPALYQHQVSIAVILVILLMMVNLRGLRESAGALMVPVYLFVVSVIVLIIVGVIKIATGQLPYHATSHIGGVVPGITIALLLRAFSSGSASLTGVEAISNAVPFFKKPRATNAAKTLTIMSLLLGFFFVGITFLNYWLGVVPEQKVTVLSQVAKLVFDNKVLFYIFQVATAGILAVAANTGFSAFPMLSFNLAKNKYMPHMYLSKGDRLGHSNGIITLSAGAIILLLIFKGSTERLIPLYSIGVFIPFALAQTGMIVKWRREKKFHKAISNIVGAFISYAIIVILFMFRMHDIWPFFVVTPVLLFVFYNIKKHYKNVAEQLKIMDKVDRHEFDGNTVIVLVGNVTQVDVGALNYARSIGDNVIAMHVSTEDTKEKDLEVEENFKCLFPDVRFSIVHSSFTDIVKPVVRFVDLASKVAEKKNKTITVLVPQFVPNQNWQQILHNQTSFKIRLYLSWRENIVISTYSYHLKR
jgi:amino acid transporter